ncbi:hypothetical protein [Aphanizomenon flos-aquae]|jgi:hypothetical protein|uniref:Uncharacterized protein n=1 Tax=Aphanizomenon flos-aquae FACHB-1040 TaxID=2692887 RepID=A0ABR8C2S2_APHFL|nr:hypothetical protein [Aphanizomenon flos-aquae]MBD2281394.1 hypothetical protein [Aphanizomenon flos-aquae FACHB-1040]
MPKNNSTDLIIYQIGPQSTKFFKPTPIIHNLHWFSQDSGKKNGRLRQLKKLISQRKLTESLEVLEQSGISGDFALFMIQNIQTLEVA